MLNVPTREYQYRWMTPQGFGEDFGEDFCTIYAKANTVVLNGRNC
jgi:hypothetical protein